MLATTFREQLGWPLGDCTEGFTNGDDVRADGSFRSSNRLGVQSRLHDAAESASEISTEDVVQLPRIVMIQSICQPVSPDADFLVTIRRSSIASAPLSIAHELVDLQSGGLPFLVAISFAQVLYEQFQRTRLRPVCDRSLRSGQYVCPSSENRERSFLTGINVKMVKTIAYAHHPRRLRSRPSHLFGAMLYDTATG
jgi:hypothetical protein